MKKPKEMISGNSMAPFFKQYTGASLLGGMDPGDLKQRIFTHLYLTNKQLEQCRQVHSVVKERGLLVKVNEAGEFQNLAPDHVPVDFDALGAYFKNQRRFGEMVARTWSGGRPLSSPAASLGTSTTWWAERSSRERGLQRFRVSPLSRGCRR